MNKVAKKNSVILFFVDGLGIAAPSQSNPLSISENVAPLAYFEDKIVSAFGGGIMKPTDATLGVSGRPQSATGQTTIYTGINAPELLGRHHPGFPNKQLREVIAEKSIFKQLNEAGISPNIFANTYTPKFFETTPRWKSATTCAVEAAGIPFCRLPDLVGKRSVFHDFTNRSLISEGINVEGFSPQQAGEIIANLSKDYRFVLYEHFITDKIGHEQNMEMACRHLPELAAVVRSVVTTANLATTSIVLTSDHGNIEDLSIRNHTLNKVPTVVWGHEKETLTSRIESLADFTPAIIELLKNGNL